MFDYQELVYNNLQQYRHLWILKATGLGISEFFLRYMAWLCLKDDTYQNSQMVIVTGPNVDLAVKLIRRMKLLFEPLNIFFDSKETILELNKCRIESYPSNHIDSFRSLDNPKFILLDEADFFRKSESELVRAVAERYIAKSNPFIILVSTPNAPEGLMQTIENESENCLYERMKLDYRYGLNKIYSVKDIEKAKQSPSFDREYDLKYLGKIGNVFALLDIENAIELGERLKDLPISGYSLHLAGVDFGFSSSVTTVYVAEIEKEHNTIRIIHGAEYDRKTPSFIADEIFELHKKIPNLLVFCDGANRGATNQLKSIYGESIEWIKYEEINPDDNIVIPVNFGKEHKIMLQHTYQLLTKGKIAIPKKYEKLILSLKTAYAEDFSLIKEESPYNDHLDSLRLLCKGVLFQNK